MLSSSHFYHKLTRKYIIAFGNMFNDMSLVKYNDTNTELERIKVPILFGPKEHYITRLLDDPNITKELQITLPRMSFDITGFRYDHSRKLDTMYYGGVKKTSNTSIKTTYMGVPYDLSMELYIYARNIDDGNQMVEQIIPYFTPDYTPTIQLIPDVSITRDIPIILDNVVQDITYEGGQDSIRLVQWTLSFTMKAWYYGVLSNTGLIRQVIANIFNDPSLQSGYITRINTDAGNNGDFQLDDFVYQGNDYNNASAIGKVIRWSKSSQSLYIGGTQGIFAANTNIHSLSTNAVYNLVSFVAQPLKLAEIVIDPKPITAGPDDDYGYTTTITEWPSTLS